MALGVRPGRGGVPLQPTTWRERLGALRNLPPLVALVWRTSRLLTSTTLAVRLVRALLPVATLFVGKLIIDEVVHLTALTTRPVGFTGWLSSGLLGRLEMLLLVEFALKARKSHEASRAQSANKTIDSNAVQALAAKLRTEPI